MEGSGPDWDCCEFFRAINLLGVSLRFRIYLTVVGDFPQFSPGISFAFANSLWIFTIYCENLCTVLELLVENSFYVIIIFSNTEARPCATSS